jgi:hypothetical protein
MNAISLTWQPEGAFHHVGFVVASIPNSVQGFASMLQADWDKQVFHVRRGRGAGREAAIGCALRYLRRSP